MNSDEREKLIIKLQETTERLRKELDSLPRKRIETYFFADPVRTKNLEKIAGYVQSILVYLDANTSQGFPLEGRAESLLSLLDRLQSPNDLSSNNAWEIADLLDIELLWFSDDAFLYTLLEAERGSTSDIKRNNHFPGDYLQRLLNYYHKGSFEGPYRLEVIHFLEHLKQALITEYRRDRAKVQLRGIYLLRMALVLAFMLLGLSVSYIISSRQSDQPSTQYLTSLLVLMVFAGATGSVLSRAVTLGKQPLNVTDAKETSEAPLGIRALLSDWKVFVAQPVIGAATALVIFLIVSSGLLQIGGMKELSPPGFALIGFLSGFSEPFFVGTLERISSGWGKAT